MSESEEISRAEFARRVRVSRAAVTIAANEGRFTSEAMAGKKLRVPLALEQWNANKRGEFEDEDDFDDRIAPAGSVASEKQRAYRLRADKLELENAEKRGELISRAAVQRGLQEAGAKIASDLDAITAWSEELAAIPTGDVAAMRAALRTRSRKLRELLAERLEKATAGDTAADDDAE